MPEAIATQKRKFHRLLDTLTSYANAPALPAESTTPVTAREKLEQASERVRKRQRQDDGSLSSIESRLAARLSTTSLRKKPALPKAVDQTPPNFSPWSQETFLQRLHTFSRVTLWYPKPKGIDEVAWAKRGWRCVDVNTVGCEGGCGSRVVVKIELPARSEEEEDNEDEESLEAALTTRYEHEIIEGHDKNCLWRKAGCKDDIQRLQVVRPAIGQPALKQRYLSLLTISKSIQDVAIQEPATAGESVISCERIVAELPADVLPIDEGTEETRVRAVDIAIHGWRGNTELSADLLHCDACFQRIGLWMYQPGYHARAAIDDEEDASSLDLLNMHREYCPWRSAESQQATGSLEGLNASQILRKVIATWIRERRRKTEEDNPSFAENIEPEDVSVETPKLSREEIDKQDRERESRLQKLKRMLSIKRYPKTTNR